MNNQFNEKEAKQYWKEHSKIWKNLDREKDKAGLSNVCHPGSPLWYNKFFAYWQKVNVIRILEDISWCSPTKVLEIGCGTGRWCKLLSKEGFEVTGIDIQKETIEQNRELIPSCKFYVMSADDLEFKDNEFDLVVSITVLQHIPYETQQKVFEEITRVLNKGGYFLMLENTKDKAPHVFSRPFKEWIDVVRSYGLNLINSAGEEYAPFLRAFDKFVYLVSNAFRNISDQSTKLTGSEHAHRMAKELTKIKTVYYAIKFPLVLCSWPIEAVCDVTCPNTWAKHGVYLFRKI